MGKKFFIVVLLAGLFFDFALPAYSLSSMIIVNKKRHVYHELTCSYAKRCKRSCIKVPRVKIKAYRARPCKICHKKLK